MSMTEYQDDTQSTLRLAPDLQVKGRKALWGPRPFTGLKGYKGIPV